MGKVHNTNRNANPRLLPDSEGRGQLPLLGSKISFPFVGPWHQSYGICLDVRTGFGFYHNEDNKVSL
jgi:hypothetical protein